MTEQEAFEYLYSISWKLGGAGAELLSEKDGVKMREALRTLQERKAKLTDMSANNVPDKLIDFHYNALGRFGG